MAKRILVVDDEKQIVDIVKAYLEREGYRVIVAYEGKSAIDLTRRDRPDLMVLDLMLPEISGWDVCRTLRKESDLPIIMLTAKDEEAGYDAEVVRQRRDGSLQHRQLGQALLFDRREGARARSSAGAERYERGSQATGR